MLVLMPLAIISTVLSTSIEERGNLRIIKVSLVILSGILVYVIAYVLMEFMRVSNALPFNCNVTFIGYKPYNFSQLKGFDIYELEKLFDTSLWLTLGNITYLLSKQTADFFSKM